MKILKDSKLIFKKINLFTLLIFGIASAIFLFALLLMLPISTKNSLGTPPLSALYTSVSAFTLCGSSFAEGSSYWTAFGLSVIALCIQTGALTIMTISVSLFLRLGQLIKIRYLKFNEYFLSASNSSLSRILKYIALYMLIFEISGALLYSFVFIPAYGVKSGIIYSAFTSLSVFTNCGMKALPVGVGEIFNSNILYNLVTFVLAFSGGIGFIPLADIIANKSLKNTAFNTKISVYGMVVLSLLCGLLFLITEHINQSYLSDLPFYSQTAAAMNLPQSVRCAQSGTFDFSKVSFAGKTLAALIMILGSTQYSFSGGLRISTVFAFVVFIISCAKGNEDYELFNMSFERKTIKKSIYIISLFVVNVFILAFALTASQNVDFFTAFFEAVSAFTLSGITINKSILLSDSGKFILMLGMLCGRFGSMYILYKFDKNKPSSDSEIIKITKPTNLAV